jgi:microcin C transport system ATP-binding protein
MSPPLLEISRLGVEFHLPEGVTTAVDGLSLKIEKGQTVALVGESGSGKSVCALSILQLLPYPVARHTPGSSIRFKGEEVVGANENRLRAVRGDQISMIFQEPMVSLNPLHVVEKQIKRLASYPHQLSGGQRQRVMIAMALANEPDLLIADEPTTALDVTIQAQVLTLLRGLQAKLGMSMLLITHDLGIVRKMAEQVSVMQAGRVVESGSVEKVFATPEHPYTQRLLAAEPKGDPLPAPAHAPTLMHAENVKVWFPVKRGLLRRTVDYIKAVDGISVTVREGHTVGVVGESGSGKTTLGLALLRLQSSEGVIFPSARSSPRVWKSTAWAAAPRAARRSSSRCWKRWAWTRKPATAIPTSSPADSANASPSPGPWC